MDWIVPVSASERASGGLAPETERAAHLAFHEHGCVLLRGAFAPATVEAMHREYIAQVGMLDSAAMQGEAAKPAPNRFLQVGDRRYDIALQMTGIFGAREVFANPALLKVLNSLLGPDMHLSSLTVVASHPGAAKQHAHSDHPHLFREPELARLLPIYAVNVAVPLIDIDLETGPTGIWLGSHRSADQEKTLRAGDPTVCRWQRGDCALLDYRTLHAGLPNRSAQVRPIVYIVYARPWFFDHGNHVRRCPLNMPLERYIELPLDVRPLLTRAFTYATFAGREAGSREPMGEPSHHASCRSNVGRNQPCPCGSGKKYKHCHGSLGAGEHQARTASA